MRETCMKTRPACLAGRQHSAVLSERFVFRDILPEEADQAAEVEQICFPPNEACAPEMMRRRAAVARSSSLWRWTGRRGRSPASSTGLPRTRGRCGMTFSGTPVFTIRRGRTSCSWGWMSCLYTAAGTGHGDHAPLSGAGVEAGTEAGGADLSGRKGRDVREDGIPGSWHFAVQLGRRTVA